MRASSSVQSFVLPEGAPWLDRATLRAWKAWDAWARPVLAAAALMVVGHMLIALVSGFNANAGFNTWRLLVKWGPQPLYPVPHGASHFILVGGTGIGSAVLAWSVGAQLVASLTGAFAALPVLRRHARPVILGIAAGLLATIVHVTASHSWTIYPLGGAPIVYGVTGLFGLWSPALFGPVAGVFAGWVRGDTGRSRVRVPSHPGGPEI